jgi:hypothetical protein
MPVEAAPSEAFLAANTNSRVMPRTCAPVSGAGFLPQPAANAPKKTSRHTPAPQRKTRFGEALCREEEANWGKTTAALRLHG